MPPERATRRNIDVVDTTARGVGRDHSALRWLLAATVMLGASAASAYEIQVDTAIKSSSTPQSTLKQWPVRPTTILLTDADEINHELKIDTAVTSNKAIAALKRIPKAALAAGTPILTVNNADTGPLLMETRAETIATATDRLAGLPYNREISEHAKQYQLDPALVHAVILVESGHNPHAVSPKGATGLMQLMPGTADRFGVRDRRSPSDNIRGGTAYLRFLVDFFEGNLSLAIAAYNAGEGAVVQYGRKIPPYQETQEYVPKVLAQYRRLRSAKAEAPTSAHSPGVKVSLQGRAGR